MTNIGRSDVVVGVEPVRLGHFDVDVSVVDDDQMSLRGHCRQQRTLCIPSRCAQQGRVLRGDQVVATRTERRVEQPGVQPLHLYVGPVSRRAGATYCNLCDVDRRDLPSEAGQPDGVSPFSTADVKCPARPEAGKFRHERTVGLTAPHLVGL